MILHSYSDLAHMAASGRRVLVVCATERSRYETKIEIANLLPPNLGIKAGGNKNLITFFQHSGFIHLVLYGDNEEVRAMEYHDSFGVLTTEMSSRVRLDDVHSSAKVTGSDHSEEGSIYIQGEVRDGALHIERELRVLPLRTAQRKTDG